MEVKKRIQIFSEIKVTIQIQNLKKFWWISIQERYFLKVHTATLKYVRKLFNECKIIIIRITLSFNGFIRCSLLVSAAHVTFLSN